MLKLSSIFPRISTIFVLTKDTTISNAQKLAMMKRLFDQSIKIPDTDPISNYAAEVNTQEVEKLLHQTVAVESDNIEKIRLIAKINFLEEQLKQEQKKSLGNLNYSLKQPQQTSFYYYTNYII